MGTCAQAGDSFYGGFAEMCHFWDTPGGVVC